MSWLPRTTLTVNVEAESKTLRCAFTSAKLFLAQLEVNRDAPVRIFGRSPTRAIPFAGVFMPRPEWVW